MSRLIYWDTIWRETVERYYQKQVDTWWLEDATLDHAMDRLLHTFRTTITESQSMNILTARKYPKRSWPEYLLYFVAVCDSCAGGAEAQVLYNIVHNTFSDNSSIFIKSSTTPNSIICAR